MNLPEYFNNLQLTLQITTTITIALILTLAYIESKHHSSFTLRVHSRKEIEKHIEPTLDIIFQCLIIIAINVTIATWLDRYGGLIFTTSVLTFTAYHILKNNKNNKTNTGEPTK